MRTINKDGSLNVRRTAGFWSWCGSSYMYLITMRWPRFLAVVLATYLVVNTLFASIYSGLADGALRTSEDLGLSSYWRAFFFSVHTLTTVGYGDIYPLGLAANVVAAVEAAVGLMGFALATGLLFARFSRPSPRLAFGHKALIAPYQEGRSLQFRVANRRDNVLMDVQAEMMLMTVEADANGQLKRTFEELKLERREIVFLALTWTVVHPIDETSPLWGKTEDDLRARQAEVLIVLRSFDESFSQVVHSRYSYRWDEIEWSAQFLPAFEVAPEGHLLLDIHRVGHFRRM